MNIEKEIWKDIPGYEGYYAVSNMGRVKSLQRTVIKRNGRENTVHEKILKNWVTGNTSTHRRVTLRSKNKTERKMLVHRLVYCTFNSISYDCIVGYGNNIVLHKNDLYFDNRLVNLYLGNQKQNCIDREVNKKSNKGNLFMLHKKKCAR